MGKSIQKRRELSREGRDAQIKERTEQGIKNPPVLIVRSSKFSVVSVFLRFPTSAAGMRRHNVLSPAHLRHYQIVNCSCVLVAQTNTAAGGHEDERLVM